MKYKNLYDIIGNKKAKYDFSIGERKGKIHRIVKNYKLLLEYPTIYGNNYFKSSIKKWIYKRYKVKVKKKYITPTLGNRNALFSFFINFLNKKKYIAFFRPYYPIYYTMSKYFKKKILLLNRKDYKKTLKKYFKNINFIIICNPNNPDGKILKKKDINYLINISKNIPIISDECYSDVYKRSVSFFNYIKKVKNITIINSLSKIRSLPGIRSGFMFSKKKFNSTKFSGDNLSNFIQLISSKLWRKNNNNIINFYKKNINYCYKKFKSYGLKKPEGGIYFWFKIKKFGINSVDFCKLIFIKHSIKIMPGIFFGKKYYIRIALIMDKKKCFFAMKKIFKTLYEIKKNKKYI
ncbi:pyridoxal phosphate-dependent aminotransferase [Candidatus Vidania fulgoroideorum]